MPDWLPSTVTSRTLTTTASCTVDSRCASPRWTTSGLVVEQAARASTTPAINRFFM
ncbi:MULTISPECIES: hypothetical protein [unclassified Methylibium]|uniref:hypothetical protein n=1 Tax=unclassified Methylibium TaxID=2633235 RepID=UPI001E503BD5|nr:MULTISPECIES: hypothetical protein [unclassified Methylibium]